MTVRYVDLGPEGAKRFLYDGDRKTKVRQVLWGDYLDVEEELPDGWLRVIWKRKDAERRELFIPKDHTVARRPLEIIFLDVGQGDGAIVFTPETGDEERIFLVDAGHGRNANMARYLAKRFKTYRGFDFHAAVITHPDEDHYGGFLPIFSNEHVGFDVVYHSGLVERPVSGTWEKLGATSSDTWLTDLPQDDGDIEEIFDDPALAEGRFVYPKVMHAAVANPKIRSYRMLSTEHGAKEDGRTYMPEFAPADARGYTIEVLGPVVEPDDDGTPRLRKIESYGETKNGHSVLLRLTYGGFNIFFGGDLNAPAERFLLQHHTGTTGWPEAGSDEHASMIAAARKRFRSEVLKVCHHGSEKVTDEFLAAVDASCFVISSGDEEGHVHPRPDLLGRLGRLGRGAAPVIVATELQRSTRELEAEEEVAKILTAVDKLTATPSEAKAEAVKRAVTDLARPNTETYGQVHVKTDGDRLIVAFEIEADSPKERWFYFEYEIDAQGDLQLVR